MAEATEIIRDPASFRDPSGFIFERDGIKLRQVNAGYAADYDHFLASGLYDELVAAGLLLAHEELPSSESTTDEAYKVLLPAQLSWVSYPYEWSFSQLRDAALVTLEIQRRALAKGMTLKDASAYNVQLHRGRATFIDTLSFERHNDGQAWIAYRQFCQHFLGPLALMSRTDVRLNQLLRVYLDGVPLDLASRLLPWKSRFSLSLGLHIHAHARIQRRHEQAATPNSKSPLLSRRQFNALISGLDAAVRSLRWNPPPSEWSDYYAANNNYGEQGMDAKQRLVRKLLEQVGPRTVWDLAPTIGASAELQLNAGLKPWSPGTLILPAWNTITGRWFNRANRQSIRCCWI